MNKKNLFLAIAFVLGSGAFAFADSKEEAKAAPSTTEASASDVMYDLKESPTGPTLFSGNEAAIISYNNANYQDCNGAGDNCTYVYEQGTSTRNTSLERHEP